MRLQRYLINESRGIRANKIGREFKFIGNNYIKGDGKNYTLIEIEDIDVSRYDSYTRKIKKFKILNVNNPKNMKNAMFLYFVSKHGNKKIVIVRFSKKISNVQSKNVGMKLTSSSESMKMKPQDFKIPYKLGYILYVNHVRNMIQTLYNKDTPLKTYLNFLIDYVESEGKVKLNVDTKHLQLNQIGKNFGEILGPIALFNDKNLFSVDFDKGRDKILMPTVGNEKLLDYIIKKDNLEYNFSAKYKKGAAASLSSIYDIINNNLSKFKEFAKEIEVINIIMDNSSIEAPVILCKKWGFINESQWDAWINEEYNSPVWDKLKETKKPRAKNQEEARNKPWWILSIMAYMVADHMNSNEFDFRGLILKAMNIASVTQINMSLNTKGIPSFKVYEKVTEDIEVKVDAKKGYFSTGRPKQKMSFKIG